MTRFVPTLAALAFLCVAQASAAGPDLRPKLEALSAAGSGEAAYHLGMIHHLGLTGAKKDARRAFELFKLSAARGDPLGAYKLGCYYYGQGEGVVEDDADLALRHKLAAAQAGYSLAQFDVARLYHLRGEPAETLRWLEAAANQGHVESLAALATFHAGDVPDNPIARDPAKAFAYLLKMARSFPDAGPEPTVEEMRKTLPFAVSTEEAKRGEALAAGWREAPTALTLKALSGERAAEQLLADAQRPNG
jgi:hypothetical protein